MKWYACGSNGTGLLGLPHLDDPDAPEELTIYNTTFPAPDRIVSGGRHSVHILSESGLLVWGASGLEASFEQCSNNGFQPKQQDVDGINVPRQLTFQLPIKQVACGWEHTLILTRGGQVYTFGIGADGRLGLGFHIKDSPNDQSESNSSPYLPGYVPFGVHEYSSATKNINSPQMIPLSVSIVGVAAGEKHSLAVATNGSVYAWGTTRHNATGIDVNDISSSIAHASAGSEAESGLAQLPRFVPFPVLLSGIARMLASDSATFSRVEASAVSNGSSNASAPESEYRIHCGWNSSYLLIPSGTLFSWGGNRHGQLGRGYEYGTTIVENNPESRYKAPGKEVFSLPPGVVRFPPDEDASVSTSSMHTDHSEARMDLRNTVVVQSISVGWTHVLARMDNSFGISDSPEAGDLYVWGRNNLGQLGPIRVNDLQVCSIASSHVPLQLHLNSLDGHNCGTGVNPSVVSFASGSEHCLVSLDCQCVYGWGWNEHNNLGKVTMKDPADERGKVPLDPDVVPQSVRVPVRISFPDVASVDISGTKEVHVSAGGASSYFCWMQLH